MPYTLRDYRQGLGQKLSGFYRGTVSIGPDPLDQLAQRSVLSADLYDADKGSKGFADTFVWVGKYKNQRRIRENGYRSLAYTIYEPPTSGTYRLTFYGYGESVPIDFDATAEVIDAALPSGLAAATVTIVDGRVVIGLPDIIDTEISNGTMIVQGGIGALEANRGFTKALQPEDEFEISSKLPVADADHIQGLNTIINMALRKIWFIDRFPITPTTNSLGTRTFHGLTGYDWLTSKTQIIAIYNPTAWTMVARWTPPTSGTFTMQLNMGGETFITNALDYTATASEIEAELERASGLVFDVDVDGSEFVITLEKTFYATPILTSSYGTPEVTVSMLESPSRYSHTWNLQYDGESPYIDNLIGQEGYSFLVSAHRPSHTWIAPQTAYGTPGSMWLPSNVGLVDDYDQAVPALEDVVTVAYAVACHQLSLTGPGNETEYWKREAKEADRVAAGVKLFDLPVDDKPRGGTGMSAGWGSKGYWGRW